MVNRTSAGMRIAAAAVIAVCLIAAAPRPASAQDSGNSPARAQQVREMVLKQRERVLAQIEAILSGEKETSQHRQVEPAEEGDVMAEISEPEGDEAEGVEAEDDEAEGSEPEDGEAEDGESEDDEGEEEDVQELPETGVGGPRGADPMSTALAAALGALAAIVRAARAAGRHDRDHRRRASSGLHPYGAP